MVTKINGFRAPYRSQTFQEVQEAVTKRNGILQMSGVVSQSGPDVTIPPFVAIQNGLIFENTLERVVTAPSMDPPYYVAVSSTTPANTDDLVFKFLKAPEDITENDVLIAENDGNEWRELPHLAIKELILSTEDDRLDTFGSRPLTGLTTEVDGLNFRNIAGRIIDKHGFKAVMEEDFVTPIIDDDPEVTYERVDRIIYRRPEDDDNRPGYRKFLVGPTYTSGSTTLYGTQLESNASAHDHVKVLIASDNTVHFIWSRGYGEAHDIIYAKYSSDRSTAIITPTTLVSATSAKFDAAMDGSDNIHLVYENSDDIYWRKFDDTGVAITAAVAIDGQVNPCLNPTVAIDPYDTKVFFAFQVLVSPAVHQIYFGTVNITTGAIITATAAKTATLTNMINPHIHVENDLRVYLAYEEQPLGKIFYQAFDDIGALISGLTPLPVLVSADTSTTSFGTLVNGASSPRIWTTDNEELFITFLQDKSGANLLAVYADGSAYGNDITGVGEDFTSYDVYVDSYMNQVYLTLVQAGQIDFGYIEAQAVVTTVSLSVSGGLKASIVKDRLGSLVHMWTVVSPGSYTNTGTPQTVSDIGPVVIVGSMNTVSVSNDEMLLPTPVTYTPLVGDQFTIAGSLNGNNGTKIVEQVTLVSINAVDDYYLVKADSSFAAVESPAAAVSAQFAAPDGNAVRFIKSIADVSEDHAFRTDVLDTDTLLSRIAIPGPTILNYIPSSTGPGLNSDVVGIYGDAEVDWESTLAGNLTITDDMFLIDLVNNITYQSTAGSFPMAENDALYIVLDGVSLTPTPQVTQINTLPWSDPIQVLGYVRDGKFYPHLLSIGGVDELTSGETVVIGKDLAPILRSRLGIVSDTAYEAYTSTQVVNSGNSYAAAISNLDLAEGQDRNLKLVRGGTWFHAPLGTLSWDANAYIQIAGITEDRNTVSSGSVNLTADGMVAYVSVNRDAGVGDSLAISTAQIDAIVPSRDLVIIARRLGSEILVGTGTIKLAVNESQSLESGLSNESLSALGLPSEADEGQLRIMAITSSTRIRITPTDALAPDTTTWGNEISGLRMQFDGFQIDLETGNYYEYGDGTVAGSGPLIGSAFTPDTFTSPNLYRRYSINLVADTTDSDGTMLVKPLILAGEDGSTAAAATNPSFSSKKLGQVLVQAPGTGSTINDLAQEQVVQLATGSGGGGSSAPKLIGGGTFLNTFINTGFNINTGFDNDVTDIDVQTDGKILATGQFTAFDGNTRNRLARLNLDGSDDTDFNTNLGTGFNATTNVVYVQDDGKVLVGGTYTTFDGNSRLRLIRLNSDGTEDTAFYTTSGGVNGVVSDVAVQTDGSIVVGGDFTTLNGSPVAPRVMRLDSDGNLDTAFNTNLGTGFGSTVTDVFIQSDGKILVGGTFTTFNGNTRNRIVRLNSDGTEDTTFYTNLSGGAGAAVRALAEQSDNKILIGGDFTTFGGSTHNHIIRLNSDGTEDTAFYTNLGTGFSSAVYSIIEQPDLKLLIGGSFSTFNGNTRRELVRLNNSGTEDTSFYTNLGTGFSGGLIEAILVQEDDKILVGGRFTSLDSNTRNRLVRLESTGVEETQTITAATALTFTDHIYVEQPRLDYADNRINSSNSPLLLETTDHVAYIDRLNAAPGGPDLTVNIDLITNVKDGQIIIARRDGVDVLYGSTTTRLAPGESSLSEDGLTDQEEDKIFGHKVGFIRSEEEVFWSGTQLEFDSDIIFETISKDGTAQTYSVPSADSPVVIADGTYAYLTIDRTQATEEVSFTVSATPPAESDPGTEIIIFAKRFTELGVSNLYLPFLKQLIAEGQQVKLGAAGSSTGTVKATFLDPLSTTLPTGVTVNFDGVAGVDGDLVLFTNLSSDNNRIYELQGVGVSISFTAQRSFSSQYDPTTGDSVRILSGDAFAGQLAVFDGTNFFVNDVIRLFDGVSADFQEISSIKNLTLVDNTTDGEVFSVSVTGSENWIVSYSVLRGAGNKQTGQLFITSDGTSVSITNGNAPLGDTGVEFNADINAGDIRLLYTTSSTGSDATMKYFVMRWSNSAGGPTGVPDYGTSPTSSVEAAGATGDVQYRGSTGNLDADPLFKWDESLGAIDLNGLKYFALQGPVTLLDNQTNQTIFSYASTNKYLIVEYSITRNTDEQLGRLLVVTNGASVSLTDDNTLVGTPGVTFSAAISGPDVLIRYTTTSTGFDASFKYTMRRWS